MGNLIENLKKSLEGEVRNDHFSKAIYSTDASFFSILPLAVVFPKSLNDIVRTVKLASKFGVSVVPRGGGTGLTGACIGSGVILDTSKYLNAILDLNVEEKTVVCEPGVIQDDLNSMLSKYALRLGPDTSTSNRATVGGMLSNNSSGAYFLRYGAMLQNVLEVEVVLANGDIATFKSLNQNQWLNKSNEESFEGQIYKGVAKLLEAHREEISTKFPKIKKRSQGYNLDYLLSNDKNLAHLIVGSEGTLGIVTKIKLKIVEKPKKTNLLILSFKSMESSLKAIPLLLKKSL